MQVEALAQGRNLVRHVLGPLLGRESPALGVEIKQSVLLYHDGHALGLVPQGVDALFLPGQLHRVGSIRHQPHLLNLHAQVSLVQTSDGQLLADFVQGYRIRIGTPATADRLSVPKISSTLSMTWADTPTAGKQSRQRQKRRNFFMFLSVYV